MPELPEVESVRRKLQARLVGQSISQIDLLFPGILSYSSSDSEPALPAEILSINRKGKILDFRLSKGQRLLAHFRMTGAFYVLENGSPLASHTHAVFQLVDGRRFAYRDPRRFGRLWWVFGNGGLDRSPISKLGPDAFSIPRDEFIRRLGRPRRMMKPLLLDQSVISGIGNIYSDESLYAAGVHPRQPSDRLTEDRLGRLWEALRRILGSAIESGGSTIRDFADSDGRAGHFQNRHMVYNRAGEPCRRCGTALRRMVVTQRGTTFCPVCQPMRRGRPRRRTPPV